jgi:hypothetical protein
MLFSSAYISLDGEIQTIKGELLERIEKKERGEEEKIGFLLMPLGI